MNLKDKLDKCKGSPEWLKYHPEGDLFKHIQLVALKAYLFTGDINQILAAILHDCCKPDSGEIKVKPEGNYHQNLNHAVQALEYIENTPEVQEFILGQGGDVEIVKVICANHTRAKHHDKLRAKVARWYPEVSTFAILDDMVDRHGMVSEYRSLYLPGEGILLGQVEFVGQTVLDRGKNRFTVCVNRKPRKYKFEDIPTFFEVEGLWEIAELLK